jgi:hypothetical protein
MGILMGIVSFILGFFINLLDAAVIAMLDSIGYDVTTFISVFPFAGNALDTFEALGLATLMVGLIWQAIKGLGAPFGVEYENPLHVVGKVAITWFAVVNLMQILDIFTNIFRIVLSDLSSQPLNPTAGGAFSVDGLISNLAFGLMADATAGLLAIVYVIFSIVLGWKFVKLLIEMVERYIVYCFICLVGPTFIATAAFKSTRNIAETWFRAFFGQSLLILLNTWSARMFLSYAQNFSTHLSGMSLVLNPLVMLFFGFAFLSFASRIDSFLRILGLNTAHTGSSMGQSLIGGATKLLMGIRGAQSIGGAVSNIRNAAASAGGWGTNAGRAAGIGALFGFKADTSGGGSVTGVPAASSSIGGAGIQETNRRVDGSKINPDQPGRRSPDSDIGNLHNARSQHQPDGNQNSVANGGSYADVAHGMPGASNANVDGVGGPNSMEGATGSVGSSNAAVGADGAPYIVNGAGGVYSVSDAVSPQYSSMPSGSLLRQESTPSGLMMSGQNEIQSALGHLAQPDISLGIGGTNGIAGAANKADYVDGGVMSSAGRQNELANMHHGNSKPMGEIKQDNMTANAARAAATSAERTSPGEFGHPIADYKGQEAAAAMNGVLAFGNDNLKGFNHALENDGVTSGISGMDFKDGSSVTFDSASGGIASGVYTDADGNSTAFDMIHDNAIDSMSASGGVAFEGGGIDVAGSESGVAFDGGVDTVGAFDGIEFEGSKQADGSYRDAFDSGVETTENADSIPFGAVNHDVVNTNSIESGGDVANVNAPGIPQASTGSPATGAPVAGTSVTGEGGNIPISPMQFDKSMAAGYVGDGSGEKGFYIVPKAASPSDSSTTPYGHAQTYGQMGATVDYGNSARVQQARQNLKQFVGNLNPVEKAVATFPKGKLEQMQGKGSGSMPKTRQQKKFGNES